MVSTGAGGGVAELFHRPNGGSFDDSVDRRERYEEDFAVDCPRDQRSKRRERAIAYFAVAIRGNRK
jgi:hypothetical protein